VPATLVQWIGAVARAHARRPAVYGDGVAWTYDELWGRAGGIAHHLLHERGLRPGDRVGIVGANEPAYLAAYLGVLRAGCVTVPLNAMLSVEEMRDQLAHVEAACVFTGAVGPEVRDGLGAAIALRELPVHGSGALPQPAAGDPACIFLTSGSTGRPKGVVHTQGSLLHMALVLAAVLPFGPGERSIAFLPFFASAEQVLPTLCTGGALDVLPGFDPERIALAARRGGTSFDAVPTVMARLLDQAPPEDLARLRWVSYASELMPAALLRRWWDALPGVPAHQFYGMTELVPVAIASDRLQREEPATVGVPFPTTAITAIDAFGRQASEGELVVTSPAQMLGYHGDEAATAAVMTADGAIRTGDLGRIDEQGRLFLTGRLKDLIISGGLNIAPAEIEAVACEHPDILTAVVVGIPDERWGETPVVVAVPSSGNGVAARDVLLHCRNGLTAFKRPSAAALVDVLPSTGIGKSAKSVIRRQILAGEIELVRAD
jgi:acyl-CoA synthetase (AMP-forming)/AMP-acid ligase II